ncbi:MAG: DUF2911 domain-containing protein [Cytophagales bacterium]|nr:DUF2911 domain-containing protein [Cytophagales bacterium]
MKRIVTIFSCLFIAVFLVQGQDVGGKTRVSQSRTSSANIGKCDITIKYHSPSVNGRKIFGGIVPFDFVVDGKEYPWRAGSNERTSMEFSHDVQINGKSLPAGSYGFVVLVEKDQWILIFSSGKSWGAFNYDKANDVIRVPVETRQLPFQEWLSYDFLNPESESVDIQLRWENTAVMFQVKTNATMNIMKNLVGKTDKTASEYQELALRTLEWDKDAYDKALVYLDSSKTKIDDNENEAYRRAYTFNYKVLKGEWLQAIGEKKEGKALLEEGLSEAAGFNAYYYGLNKLLVQGKPKESLAILEAQINRDPKNRANFLALGEYHLNQGNQKEATESFKQAYELSKGSLGENYCRYLYLQNKLVLERS